MKKVDIGAWREAWGGIASVQLSFAVTWAEARKRGISPALVMQWMSGNPARLVRLHERKGAIRAGCDADLVIFDEDATTKVRDLLCAFVFLQFPRSLFRSRVQVEAAALHHRHKLTPYDGRVLHGSVLMTILRGQVVAREGKVTEPHMGQMLLA